MKWTEVELSTSRARSPEELVDSIDHWMDSPPMRGLVDEFGGILPASGGETLAEFLDDFAGRNWDFRRGSERNLTSVVDFTERQTEVILSAAQALGLNAPRPPTLSHYDHILVLGGLVRACIARPKYVAKLIEEGMRAEHVTALGGFRPLGGDELRLAAEHGVDGTNEFEAMAHGILNAFGDTGGFETIESTSGDGPADWREWRSRHSGPCIHVLAAPSSEPLVRRANTVDTYRFWVRRMQVPEKSRVLVVTNPIYVPYQGAGATQVLGLEFGLRVETVGIDDSSADLGKDTQYFGPQQYLQEMRSAVYGMRNLRRAAASTNP